MIKLNWDMIFVGAPLFAVLIAMFVLVYFSHRAERRSHLSSDEEPAPSPQRTEPEGSINLADVLGTPSKND